MRQYKDRVIEVKVTIVLCQLNTRTQKVCLGFTNNETKKNLEY